MNVERIAITRPTLHLPAKSRDLIAVVSSINS